MKSLSLLLFLFLACQNQPASEAVKAISATETQAPAEKERTVGGGCECCDAWADGLPINLSWQMTIAGPNEPGQRMEISGTILKKDGKTPAPGVLLYLYHTDNDGEYSKGKGSTECARNHGHLRGWMKTDASGRYQFSSIRPASYPDSKAPQHIHPIIKEPGVEAYWIDEYLFEDDPNLTKEEEGHMKLRGGRGVIKLEKNAAGVWIGKRDIVLGLNVPGYDN